MIKIERLYSVEHRASVLGFVPTMSRDVPVYPSEGLLNELSLLSKGTSVGLEGCPEIFFQEGEDKKWKTEFYFQKIIKACNSFGLPIVYLEDIETYEELYAKLSEAERYRLELAAYCHEVAEGQLFFFDSKREISEALYRAETEAGYIRHIIREDRMIKKIIEKRLSVVIIGAAHGDFFMLEGLKFKPQGFAIKSFRKERFDTVGEIEVFDPHLLTVLTNDRPDPGFVLERELLERQYNAVTKWRVFPDRTADFIGTDDLEVRTRGLFEGFIENREGTFVSGSIVDNGGDASFEGKWDGQKIVFVKKYDPERTIMAANRQQILYEGTLRGGSPAGICGTCRFLRSDNERFPALEDPKEFFIQTGSRFSM